MGRKKRVPVADLRAQLATVKVMIVELGNALPSAARDMRRSAAETIDDVMAELARY